MPRQKRSTGLKRQTSKSSQSLSTPPENQASAAVLLQKGPRVPRPKNKSPIIQALIAELPDANTHWPVDKQLGWVKMMTMAFGMVYGGDAASRVEENVIPSEPVPAPQLQQKMISKPMPVEYPFYINTKGVALSQDGSRVLPSDVTGPIFDLRGEDGDVATITWADGSMGLNGADVIIVAV